MAKRRRKMKPMPLCKALFCGIMSLPRILLQVEHRSGYLSDVLGKPQLFRWPLLCYRSDKMSKSNRAILYAHERGYRVTRVGRVRGLKKKYLSLHNSSRGYLVFGVNLPEEKSGYPVAVHRLQAYQKFGNKIFGDGMEVRHLNNDKHDNSWGNIDIGTRSENLMDVPKEERSRISSAILSKSDVLVIVDRVENNDYENHQQLAEELGLKNGRTISDIMNGYIWSNITGIETERSHLYENDVLEIVKRVEKNDYETYQILAEEYGLECGSTISHIMSGRRWSHVTGIGRKDG